METWFIIVVTLCVAALLKSISNLFISSSSDSRKGKKLPPGPPTVPIIGNFLWIRISFSEIEQVLRRLKVTYGPFITLRIGSRLAIFVADRSLAHRALVEKGAIFSDRPGPVPISSIVSSNRKNISSSSYGPTWRLLRRNLTSEILHPARVKSYSNARKWVLDILLDRLRSHSGSAVPVMEDFQYAMFCLLVLMCFGDKLGEEQIKQIERVERELLVDSTKFSVLNFWPKLGKIVFRKRWQELIRLRRNQEDVLIPLIRARREIVEGRKHKQSKEENGEESAATVAYVDTLVDLELPDEKRKLNDSELVTLCNEFLNAGTDTTSTSLQWIMANLVKNPRIQAKLYDEISGVAGPPPQLAAGGEIKEEELQGMTYLKAVVLEGLRLHPPGHFVLPHRVTEDVELDGYLVPREATVNFMVAEMGRDPAVWDQPMEFKPERFIRGGAGGGDKYELVDFDITGSREIKMMPFGAGRRICPGIALALLHLEYFVANLVWNFKWVAAEEDEEVDLSEKQEFTVVMKNPLLARLTPRASY